MRLKKSKEKKKERKFKIESRAIGFCWLCEEPTDYVDFKVYEDGTSVSDSFFSPPHPNICEDCRKAIRKSIGR